MSHSDEDRKAESHYAQQLRLINRLTTPATRQAIAAGPFAPASRGLDAGCGIGSQVFDLAAKVGPDGHVTGLDRSTDRLQVAVADHEQRGSPPGISFQQGSVLELPFDDGRFDWVWCKDTLWTGPPAAGFLADCPLPALRELARVVRPGGAVALVYWTRETLLCGYPTLEARLQATMAERTPYLSGVEPRWQTLRARGWMAEAGLTDLAARTFVADIPGPLDVEQKLSLHQCCDMLWSEHQSALSDEDWALFTRVGRQDSADFVGHDEGYYGFVTYTMFCGRVALR